MGKQINYYMDKETELSFLAYIKELGGQFVFTKNFKNYIINDDLECFRSNNGNLDGYIYHTCFGSIKFESKFNEYIGQEYESFSEICSPIIQFNTSPVVLEEQRVVRGRVFVEMKYWEGDRLMTKPKELDDFYKKLVKWIKKHVPYQEVEINGHIRKEYISDSILKLVQEGKITKFV